MCYWCISYMYVGAGSLHRYHLFTVQNIVRTKICYKNTQKVYAHSSACCHFHQIQLEIRTVCERFCVSIQMAVLYAFEFTIQSKHFFFFLPHLINRSIDWSIEFSFFVCDSFCFVCSLNLHVIISTTFRLMIMTNSNLWAV